MIAAENIPDKAKRYSTFKYAFSISDTFFLLLLLLLFSYSGLSRSLCSLLARFLPPGLPFLSAYLLIVSIAYYFLSLPLNFYSSFLLEHKFSLSNQPLSGWVKDQIKSAVISYIIGLILVSAFYLILKYNPESWWLAISLFWIFFSLILARLTPTLIIPLFFKYKKLSDENLKKRIMVLAHKMGVKILDCFEIDFSKKTLKANAAFVGWGRSRRVILADTLKDKYSYDEIEVILAHEFAHYRLKHLVKLILLNALITLFIFYTIFKTNNFVLSQFDFTSLSEIAALPIIFIYFIFFGIISRPLECFISRNFEREADREAIAVTGLKEAFISMMEKLAAQNLADRAPHPIIKFFFFDHPPVDERIKAAA